MATNDPDSGWTYTDRSQGAMMTTQRLLRFGQKITGTDVPSVPERCRGVEGPTGRLEAVRVHPAAGMAWLVLRHGGAPLWFEHKVRVLPAGSAQPQTPPPPPETLELRAAMRVIAHDGFVGRLEGVVLDSATGAARELLVRIRPDVLAAIDEITDPLALLLGLAGQRVLLPVAWAAGTKEDPDRAAILGRAWLLQLDATAEQIAAGTRVRTDGEIGAEIWQMLTANPGLEPHLARIQIHVQDGVVNLRGSVPTARQRASIEQDVWHVPGVAAVRNDILIEGTSLQG